jgi:capsular exopolysaccharide synthesis family protein
VGGEVEVDTEGRTDLGTTLDTLRRRKTWVVGAVALALIGSLALSLRATKQYEARAQVDLPSAIQTSVFTRQALRIANPEQIAGAQIAVVESPEVARKVRERMGARFEQIESVDVQSVGEDTRLEIAVTAPSRSLARDAANHYAEVYEGEQRDLLSRGFQRGAEELESYSEELRQQSGDLAVRLQELDGRIAALQREPSSEAQQAQVSALLNERAVADSEQRALAGNIQTSYENISQLRVEAQLQRESATDIVSPAALPSDPVSPVPLRDAGIAVAVGLVIGLGLAFAREALETALNDPADLGRLLPDVPVLGTTPDEAAGRRWSAGSIVRRFGRRRDRGSRPGDLPVVLRAPRSAEAEAYRAIRTSFSLVASEGIVLFTSPAELEGRATAVANVAASLSLSGHRVVVASADLRRSELHEHFRISNEVGLSSVLEGQVALGEALRAVPGAEDRPTILPSGPAPPNPAELLSSHAAAEVIGELRAMAEYVLLDSPPCLTVTDALVTAQWADAVVLVVRLGHTKKSDIVAAAELLRRQSRAQLVGVIVTGVPLAKQASYLVSFRGSPPSPNGHQPMAPLEGRGAGPSNGGAARPRSTTP